MDEKPILHDLERLYLGIPDESVNLTFQDLANVKTTTNQSVSEISNNVPTRANSSLKPSLAKLPSLDFSIGLQSIQHDHNHHDIGRGNSPWGQFGQRIEENRGHVHVHDPLQFSHANGGAKSPRSRTGDNSQFSHASVSVKSPRSKSGGDDRLAYSMSYDDVSGASRRGGGRSRPGIPHSKICTICSTYVYVFRTRCLVCGRVYCSRCVKLGMGDMVEGRKCIECLGLKFSQRYPISLKQAELMCAEKGPRRSRRSYAQQSGVENSTSRSPMTPRSPVTPRSPRTPRSPHAIGNTNEHSFMSTSFSPFSPHHINNLPF
ncbi:hypothetical protein TSUD_213840 [Trifolium subterraneum]|uniref:Uncharacterized protein n=1 Tax=Trifolium subterraneum TaxID=3900 RepID=A0A2Z6NK62_TRISU|nr:hypothetical protein TSUD_213840 [Trifolium subterraneum]